MKIAIVDDEMIYIKRFDTLLHQILTDFSISADCIDYFLSAENFLIKWKKTKYDIIFLDIFLKDGNGISLAKRIRETDSTAKLVFCSTSNEFASESYDVDASYYLTKPVSHQNMQRMLKKLLHELSVSQPYITLEDGQHLFYQQVLYSEYHNHLIQITMKDNSVIQTWSSQKNFSALLKDFPYFIEINPGTILNMNAVTGFSDGNFQMADGNHFSASRSRRKITEKTYQEFLFNKLRRF